MIRFSSQFRCPVCGGCDSDERGEARRCSGFLSDDPGWARCTRPEHAGDLQLDTRTTPASYPHKLTGECRCGIEHGAGLVLSAHLSQPAKPSTPRRVVATYTYRDASGAVLYRVKRFTPKGFMPETPTADGGWVSGLNGVPRVVYRLPELMASPNATAWIVEGERDADTLASLGLVAVTNAGGAKSWQTHASEYAAPFRGRRGAIVLPDNDDDGRAWGVAVAASIVAVGCPVKVIALAGLPQKGDVSDWLEDHDVAELRALATEAPAWSSPAPKPSGDATLSAGAVRLSEVQPEAVEWLWHGRIARGKLTLIDGDPGLGKSLLTLDMSARLTTGAAWPDGQPCPVQGSVLLLGAEDGLADTVRPRLDAAGADAHHVYALPVVGDAGNERQPSIPDDIPAIEAQLVVTGAVLLVLDPLMAYLSGDVNSHRDQDVRRALAPLAAMADRLRVAVVVVRHLNKSSGGPAIYRGGGSIGLAGAARIVLAVGTDPEDETRRVLAPVKANLSAPSPSLAYRLVEAPGAVRIEWLGASSVTAGQLLAAPVNDEERSQLADACDFLRDRLSDGWVEAAAVTKEAGQAGISTATLKRAKARLEVASERKGFGSDGRWFWTLSAHRGSPEPIDAHPQEVSIYGNSWSPMESDAAGVRVY
jgi:putative DNA primase/helicase